MDQLLHDEEMLAALGYEPMGFERPADAMRRAVRRLTGSISSWSVMRRYPRAGSIVTGLHDRGRRPCCSPPSPRSMAASKRWQKQEFLKCCAGPVQHRTRRCAGALPAIVRHVTA